MRKIKRKLFEKRSGRFPKGIMLVFLRIVSYVLLISDLLKRVSQIKIIIVLKTVMLTDTLSIMGPVMTIQHDRTKCLEIKWNSTGMMSPTHF